MSNCRTCNIDEATAVIKTGTDCGIINSTTGDCLLDSNGMAVSTPLPGSGNSCDISLNLNVACPPITVSPWDLTDSPDACLQDSYIQQQLNISGAPMNVYKMLGVHEQGNLQDLSGNGLPLSSGSLWNFGPEKAFTKYNEEWRSSQTGNNVLTKAFIGWDFGPMKLPNGRLRYGIETAVKYDISTIRIKQGCNAINRVTQLRLEHSNDGKKWYGVSVAAVQDCDGLVTIAFRKTVPSRYWRIRPVAFNGGSDDFWSVQALQLIDYEYTNVNNIQDRLLLENRDRDYSSTAISMKMAYTPIDIRANSSKFGWFNTDELVLQVNFTQTVNALGRPFIVGDIVQLPSETQYTPALKPALKYMEIIDVAWSVTGYTPGWVPLMQRLIAVPALATVENQQIFGKLTQDVDTSGLSDINDGNSKKYQDISDISATTIANANTDVPERGEDVSDVTKLSPELIAYSKKHNLKIERLDRSRLQNTADAMPPNGEAYTEGPALPLPSSAKVGDWHRLTYDGMMQKVAPRLYYFSRTRRWMLYQVDRKFMFKETKPFLEEFENPSLSSVTSPSDTKTFLDQFDK